MASRVSRRAGTKNLVCRECVKQVTVKSGITARNVGSFRGRPRSYQRHIKLVHPNG